MSRAPRSVARAALLALLSFAVPACSGPTIARKPSDLVPATLATSKSVEERYRFAAEARLRVGLGFALVAAIRENGKTAKVALGSRTLEPKRPISERDLLEIGSVSEVFTGILVHLAEAEGKLGLDRRLDSFFPGLQGAEAGAITIRELGTHRAGLDPKVPWKGLKRDDVLASLARAHRGPLAEGQTQYARSDSSWDFLLLGLVLEDVYRQPYAKLVDHRVLSALGMRESGVDRMKRARRRRVSKLAPAFDLGGQPAAPWDFEGFAAAAGGIESNAVEMAKFVEALESPPRGKLGAAIEASFASGVGWDSEPGAAVARKSGMTGGYAASVAVDRSARKSLYVGTTSAVSSEDLGAFALGQAAGDALLERATPSRVPTEEELGRLKGKYRNPKPDADPEAALKELAISESFGRMIARYGIGGEASAALLVPSAREDEWNLIDGRVNADALRLTGEGATATLAVSPTRTATLELEKLPEQVQQYPAIEQ